MANNPNDGRSRPARVSDTNDRERSDCLTDVGITAGRLLAHLQGVPDRLPVEVIFPPETHDGHRTSVASIRAHAARLQPKELVTDRPKQFVVQQVQLYSDCVEVLMGSVYFVRLQAMTGDFDSTIPDKFAARIYVAANRFLSDYEVGLSSDEVRRSTATFVELCNESELLFPTHRNLRAVLREPTDDLKAALQEWQSTPAFSGMSFGGGGFGLGAAAKGMAMAWVLNSCIGYYNGLQAAGHQNRVDVRLNSAAAKLVPLRGLFSPAAARIARQLGG